MSERVFVAPADELADGDRRIVETPRGEVGVFNVEEDYYALQNVCLHQRGPVCTGSVEPAMESRHVGLGERVEQTYTDDHVVICPWHNWEYELETGALVGEDGPALPSFNVVVEDGSVYVEV